ncbi:coiled-coil domain-containing protein 89-like [Cheilinus undulatus]|uniref:coiled-coil domain-containing protein 89-like n=1 Tax=Cheilinus undulatus TaxID=241271 RepID=UPI001BD43D88|nr:coiled-coil domain-containing protein 89-like [Cheilinus undulatus]
MSMLLQTLNPKSKQIISSRDRTQDTYKLTAELEEKKKVIEKVTKDLEVSHPLHMESEEHEKESLAENKELRKRLDEQLKKVLQRDRDISSMAMENQRLETKVEGNEQIFSSLKTKFQEQKFEISKLHGKLKAAQIAQKQLLDKRESCRYELTAEKTQYAKAYAIIQMQQAQLTDKTLALGKSKSEVKALKFQLGEASASSEHLKKNLQTLKGENADVKAKLQEVERQCDRECLYQGLSGGFTEKKSAIAELKAHQVEIITRQTQLKGTHNEEKIKISELQQRVDRATSALKKERLTCEKYRGEIKEALKRQMETLEKYTLTVAPRELRKAFPGFKSHSSSQWMLFVI